MPVGRRARHAGGGLLRGYGRPGGVCATRHSRRGRARRCGVVWGSRRFARFERRDGAGRARDSAGLAASRGGGGGVSGLAQSITPQHLVRGIARRFRRPAEDSLAVRAAVLLAVLVAVAAVGVQEEFTSQAVAAFAIIVAHGVSYLRRRSPNWWMKLVIVGLIFAVAR